MIRWALHKALGKFERSWGYDASYMHDMVDASPRAAWLFGRATAIGQFRRDLPIEAWYAAGITAVRSEDCGPCTQLAVTMAERKGVSGDVLRALLATSPMRCRPTSRWSGNSPERPSRTIRRPMNFASTS